MILAAIIFLVLLAVGGFATCDLVFDDESEVNDLGVSTSLVSR